MGTEVLTFMVLLVPSTTKVIEVTNGAPHRTLPAFTRLSCWQFPRLSPQRQPARRCPPNLNRTPSVLSRGWVAADRPNKSNTMACNCEMVIDDESAQDEGERPMQF